MSKIKLITMVGLVVVMISAFVVFPGCKTEPEVIIETVTETVVETVKETVIETVTEEVAGEVEIEDLGEILTRGPEGQVPVWFNQISLTEEEKAQVKDMNIVLAYDEAVANQFNDAIGRGIEYEARQLGMELAAWTINDMNAATQVENIENMLALSPDAIIGLSIDPVVSREAFKKAADQGVKLIFCSNKPGDFEWGVDYEGGLIVPDFIATGAFLADALSKPAKIGVVYLDMAFFITNQWDDGFRAAVEASPDLEIVAESPWSGAVNDAETAVAAMITQNPDITAIYVSYALGANAAISALRAAGNTDIEVVTNDLEATTALEMINGNYVVGLTQCRAWQYGITAADMAAYAMLGKELPAEAISIPSLGATRDNVEKVWREVFNEELPDELKEAIEE